ncbi:hypothetical protein [Falsiroseomonas sp. HW251]|uniref:hypothetical protein n=1 Tax=Falsiroseomonas sp. HW251 TaxID=3390998 RepID=UPI003D31E700
MTTRPATALPPVHPFAQDAAGWGLEKDNLALIEAEGAAMPLLLGGLGGDSASRGALLASFQLDASTLPGIGARTCFAGQLRLDFRGGEVAELEIRRLEWRSPTTLFAEIPFSAGVGGEPIYDAEPGRIARLVAYWARTEGAKPTLAASARAGVRSATQAAAVARDAATRNARGARALDASATSRAHHLWWAAKREEEAERQLQLAVRLRRLQAELAGTTDPAARSA